MTRPSGVVDGRSLAECTAMSARPSRTAACTSLTNTPCPPMAWIGTSWLRSPAVDTITGSTSTSGPSRSATSSVCRRASALPRVAARSLMRPSSFLEIEELAQGFGQPLALRPAGGVLEAHRPPVEQLADDAARERLDRVALARVEPVEPGAVPLELGGPHHLGPVAQRADRRRDLPLGGPLEIARHLLADDRPDAGDFAPALVETGLGEAL